jgi:hypothetical protein
MKFLGLFVFSLSVLIFAIRAAGEDKYSAGENGSFVTLNQGDGREFRAFVAGPADAKAAVLIVHDYFGISDATKESVQRLGALGYRSVAVDLYGGKSPSSHDGAVKLMQSLDGNTSGKILQAGLDYLKQPGRKLATIGFSMGGQESLNANVNDPEAVSASVMILRVRLRQNRCKTARETQDHGPGHCWQRIFRCNASRHQFSLHHERGETTVRNVRLSVCGSRLRATTLQ